MAFSSFTNLQGTHVQTAYVMDYVVEYGYRDWFTPADSYGPEVTARYYGTITTEISRKPLTIHGDFHTPLGYSRSGTKAMIDEPVVVSTARIISDRPVQWRDEVTLISTIFNMVEIDVPGGAGTGQNAWDQSQTEALNGLQASYAGMGANLGQARQTINEMAKSAQTLGELLHFAKSGQYGALYRRFRNLFGISNKANQKDIAGLWLAYIYGWKPLVHDLYELQKLVHADLQKQPRIKSTGYGNESYSSESSSDSKWIKRGIRKHSARCVLFGKIVNPLAYQLASAGLANPYSIAWELVPFSFVLDWFIPIGNTLQAITATVGLEPDGGYITMKSEQSSFYSLRKQWSEVPSPGFISTVKQPGAYNVVSYDFARAALSAFPLPKLYVNEKPYSTTRAINALALVRQLT